MHIVVVTRHLARAAFYYGPVLRALVDADTHLTLVGAAGTDALTEERRALHVREVAIRPLGQKPAPMEWAVLAGDLHALLEMVPSDSGTIDVLMTLEEDLAPTVIAASRALRARLVVSAARHAPERGSWERLRAQASPVWERLRGVLPDAVKTPVRQLTQLPVVPFAQEAIEPLVARVPEELRKAGADASAQVGHAAAQLKQYLVPPPVHYLLAEEPSKDAPSAGWTSFTHGAGIDVSGYLYGGTGRAFDDAAAERPLVVGAFYDPYSEALKQQALRTEGRQAVEGLGASFEWLETPALATERETSVNRWAKSYLAQLDIVLVPGNDLYAAMQAAAAGCLVITQADSLASGALRIGESGLEVAALDAKQLTMILQSLLRSKGVHRMQDAAQRRSTRLYGYELFLRRLTRGMDDHLALEVVDEKKPARVVRRHL